jgi:serine/threonine-protein kinase
MPLLQEGLIIRETYEVERFMGQGAFAEVYRVKHRFLGRQAMKVFKRSGMTLLEIEQMLGEAIMLSRIGHPNIVRVFDANVVEGTNGLLGYFTMENVAGGSLDKYWHSHGIRLVPISTTIDIMKQVCRGLSVAHREKPPIIHRDIKPQNILVGYEADGLRARVSDFGLAKSVNPLTLLATAAGTLAFKPPEAFSNTRGDSTAADVWALGATLYLLLTDQLPYKLSNEMGWGPNDAFAAAFTPASDLNPDVNPSLDRIIAKCLEKDAAKRFQTAGDLLNALGNWKPGSETIPKRRPSSATSEGSKPALGMVISSPNQSEAEKMAKNAVGLKNTGRLQDAADLMEEAFNKWPDLRDKYEPQVKLWRCGISM